MSVSTGKSWNGNNFKKEAVQFTEEANKTGYPTECCEGQEVRQYLLFLPIHTIKNTTFETKNKQ